MWEGGGQGGPGPRLEGSAERASLSTDLEVSEIQLCPPLAERLRDADMSQFLVRTGGIWAISAELI